MKGSSTSQVLLSFESIDEKLSEVDESLSKLVVDPGEYLE
jgi:hypothetical protein